ncbi:hypothetical protein PEL8287_03966 [Roseovarius litorisediminis]|uniref:Uncharacterized protein n=1 Tax=Roseovarius litorisediminis TaxID=1312363 RepID=A0A1Y5TWH2_9RHOB|nr:hypothetical protein PEL8287_03905 [Roseovarius litorisediminis]SLN72043.1 hypothetical protein PEL8287_03966 [Roseovarius litorisediminis]
MNAALILVMKRFDFGGTDLGRFLLRKFVEGGLDITDHTRIGNGTWTKFS